MKKLKASHYIIVVFVVGLLSLFYFSQGQSEKTEPKIKLTYFKSNLEVAEAIQAVVQPQLKHQKHFWFGIEPGADRELEIYKNVKELIEKENGPFDLIFVDQELKMTSENQSLFGKTVIREIKEDWGGVAQELQASQDKKTLVITASIYSTNLIAQNPISKIKSAIGFQPVTFSMGFFAVKPEDEKKIVFPCMTDDKEGVAGWGCLIVNKARTQRRKINLSQTESSITGLMDQTGEKDYMILVR